MSKKIKYAVALAGYILAAIMAIQTYLVDHPIPKMDSPDSTIVETPAK